MRAGRTAGTGATPAAALAYLRTPEAIRERAGGLLDQALDGRLRHFAVDPSRLAAAADLVASVTRERYPDLAVPLHSRWRHFGVGGHDRAAQLDTALVAAPSDELARSRIDLAVTSVLLDAGAGGQWRFREAETGEQYQRSEGLAVASFHLFAAGTLSSDPARPWRADAAALEALDDDRLARALQVSDGNPLPGVSGRAALLRRLGDALRHSPELFGTRLPRPGGLLDALSPAAGGGELEAAAILDAILRGLGPIWPGRVAIAGVNLGDVWTHPEAGGTGSDAGLVPLHKLSQWITYSLIEPLEAAGIRVTGLDRLTGLAEYRNGGLLVDLGVLIARRPDVERDTFAPGDEVVVEWRALTVALLDRLAPMVRARLGPVGARLPLTSILEGGTWAAGRRLADERRGGAPPIRVASDGTVM